jgi:hypothetical protein
MFVCLNHFLSVQGFVLKIDVLSGQLLENIRVLQKSLINCGTKLCVTFLIISLRPLKGGISSLILKKIML